MTTIIYKNIGKHINHKANHLLLSFEYTNA